MAEAAAICLAAKLEKQLSLNSVNFLTDNQSIADFFNSSDLSRPPHWNIKAYRVAFLQATEGKDNVVRKVPRQLNHTAQTLAHQAFISVANYTTFSCSCTLHPSNHICPVQEALQPVN
jgi:hypothetical protein